MQELQKEIDALLESKTNSEGIVHECMCTYSCHGIIQFEIV